MKRLFNLSIAALASVLALASCQEKTPAPVVPATITTEFTNLDKVSTDTKDGVTTIVLKASEADASIEISVLSPKVYLEAGSYSVGTATGNYTAHFKNNVVDCDVVSGGITVAVDAEDNYTITGALKLSNEQGTIVRLTAKGKIEFPAPAEWLYTKKTENNATVYSIYTLGDQNELVAMATVYGDATGKFDVNTTAAAGSAMVGTCANAGTFISIDKWGYFMQLSGTVTVQEKTGKLNFIFAGANSATYNNCEEASKVNVPAVKTPRDGMYYYKYFFAPSQIAEGAIECTAKVYTSDFKELFSSIVIVASEDFYLGENQGKGLGFMVYPLEYYVPQTIGKVAINCATYVSIDGVNTIVPDGYYVVINDKSETKGYAMIAPIDGTYTAPEPLWSYLEQNIWSFGAFVYPTE